LTVIAGVGRQTFSLLVKDSDIVVVISGNSAELSDKAISPYVVEESPGLAVDD
jgi:hypothetical protein